MIFLGVLCTLCKSLTLPWVVIVYGEFTSLLVERNYGFGTSSPTIMLKWFNGGQILYEFIIFFFFSIYQCTFEMMILFALIHFRTDPTIEETRTAIINDSIAYGILTIMATLWQFIFGIFCVDCFNRTAIRQITRIRTKYFESLMRQDIGWYDVAGGKTNFSVRITE